MIVIVTFTHSEFSFSTLIVGWECCYIVSPPSTQITWPVM